MQECILQRIRQSLLEKMSNKYYELIDRYNDIEDTATREEADKRILSGLDDSDIYMALNPDRTDCIECFPWKSSQKVLCVGANYGAYVGLAAKVHALDIADVAEERLELIKARFHFGNADFAISGLYENLRLIKEPVDNDYDVIIADITAADDEWELKGDKPGFLKSACSHLRKGGALIFIADNADALRFKAGILPKHPELLIDRSFAERVKSELNFDHVKRYYPLQNAAFARNIYSDTFMPDQGSFKFIADAGFEERAAVYNEEGLYGSLSDKGYFADYAPSYIYVYAGYSSDKAAADEAVYADYLRFNRTRADKYAIKTELYISGAKDSRFVRKQAIKADGNNHIESFMHKFELLKSDFSNIEAVKPCLGRTNDGLSYADFDYIEGRELSELLAEHIRDGRAPETEINSALSLILGDSSTECHNLDALFENVIVTDDGCCHQKAFL